MDRKIKIINILSLFIGIVLSIDVFTKWLIIGLFPNFLSLLVIIVTGFMLSIWLFIWVLKKSSSPIEKVIAGCGLLFNALPIIYFIL